MSDAEILIIGAGAGGAACAYALGLEGIDVRVLEAGPRYQPQRDYRLERADWEVHGFPAKVSTRGRQTFAPLQTLDPEHDALRSWSTTAGLYNPGTRRAAWGYHHVVGVGGSTLHFSGEAHRLHPLAFSLRSRLGVGVDWPLGYDDLEAAYTEAEQVLGVAGPADTGPRWRTGAYPLPPHPLSYASRKVAAGCRALGLRLESNALAALSRPYDGRPGCNYCGNCNLGCPRLDKGSADVTFLRKAQASGRCRIEPGSQVVKLETGPNDRVSAVLVADEMGQLRRLTPRAVVVACGAVETPRLLLSSGASSEGIANESGEVGRNLMETVAWTSVGLHPGPLGSYRGVAADGICWDFSAPDSVAGIPGGCRFNVNTWEARLTGPLGYANRIVGGFGHRHKQRMREVFGNALAIGALGESLPNDGTFVDLDPGRVDAHGVPRARIHSRLEPIEIARIGFMRERCQEILAAAGAPELVEEYGTYDGFSSTHVFGTCRMGADPRRAVVDELGRSHRWRNLAIADASVFPSSGGGEAPSLTIYALALRAGRALAAAARRLEL